MANVRILVDFLVARIPQTGDQHLYTINPNIYPRDIITLREKGLYGRFYRLYGLFVEARSIEEALLKFNQYYNDKYGNQKDFLTLLVETSAIPFNDVNSWFQNFLQDECTIIEYVNYKFI